MPRKTSTERLIDRLLRDLDIRIAPGSMEHYKRSKGQAACGRVSWHATDDTGHQWESEDTIGRCLSATSLHIRRPPQTWWGLSYIDANTNPPPHPSHEH